ncbi:Hypothetical predicted protein, partial [Xyrichtys novacula]
MEVWRIERKETSKWECERSGMLSLPRRGQVWTTIKTEFHWQPSGSSPHITREGRDICKHPHKRPYVQTHTCTYTQQYLYECAAG